MSCEDREGLTALSWAALRGHVDCMAAIIQHLTAEETNNTTDTLTVAEAVEHEDRHGRTPLDLAASSTGTDAKGAGSGQGQGQGGAAAVMYLMEHCAANMEHTDHTGMRALDRAIAANNQHVVVCFLRKGAKLGQ